LLVPGAAAAAAVAAAAAAQASVSISRLGWHWHVLLLALLPVVLVQHTSLPCTTPRHSVSSKAELNQ
jgi:hypothetical protein